MRLQWYKEKLNIVLGSVSVRTKTRGWHLHIFSLVVSIWDVITRQLIFVNHLHFEDFSRKIFDWTNYQICLKVDLFSWIVCKFFIGIIQTKLGQILAVYQQSYVISLLNLVIFRTLPNIAGPHFYNVSRILFCPWKYFISPDQKRSMQDHQWVTSLCRI